MEQDFEYNDFQDINDLISRFEEVVSTGNDPYFDIEDFEEIIDYYEENSNSKYLSKALESASQIHPHHHFFKLKIAQDLAKKEKYSEATKLLETILSSEPNNYFARQNLAYIYSQQGKPKKAIDVYLESIKRGGDLRDCWLAIAMEYENLSKYEIAISYLKKILNQFPEEDSALYEAFFCFESMEKMEESIQFFQEFTDENPYSAAAWFNLGISYSNLGLFEKAIDAYDFVIAIEEHYSSAYFNKGNALMSLEKYAEAIYAFRTTFDYEPKDSITYLYIARCYENMDALDEAVRNYFKSIELNERQAEAWAGIGIIYHQLDEKYKAIGFMEEALSIDEKNPEIIMAMAALLLDLAKLKEAATLLTNLLEWEKSNIDTWYLLSDIHALNEDLELAGSVLDEALVLFPNEKKILFKKAELLSLKGQQKEALKILFSIDIHSLEEMLYLSSNPNLLDEFLNGTHPKD